MYDRENDVKILNFKIYQANDVKINRVQATITCS